MSDAKFYADYSKRLSKCKKCKQEIEKGGVRVAKSLPNFFHDGDGDMKQYYHINCLFQTFQRARATTAIIESSDDINGFTDLNDDDQEKILDEIKELSKLRGNKKTTKKAGATKAGAAKNTSLDSFVKRKSNDKDNSDEDDDDDDEKTTPKKLKRNNDDSDDDTTTPKKVKKSNDDDDGGDTDELEDEDNDDNKFSTFIKICDKIASDSSHNAKTAVIKEFTKKGINKDGYKGNLSLFVHLLLPNSQHRVYNLNSVSLVKLYSKIFAQDQDEMVMHLNKGDVSDTIKTYFEKSSRLKPLKKSKLTLKQVDEYLNKISMVTKENEQLNVLKELAGNCTSDDLMMIIRLIKKDLRINAGEKAILDGIGNNVYEAFKVSRDLDDVLKRVAKLSPLKKELSIKINLMKPVKPMLAEACKSMEQAMKKCPNGLYAEIKYDGERLQVHKNSKSEFNYFSRNLKPVQAHKVAHLKEFIPKAFPNAKEIILDGEVLLYDSHAKKPLPFGTLGVHKKNKFKDATVCLFVFDCIYYNGKDLMNEPMKERRRILEETINEVPGRIMLSEKHFIKSGDKLKELMTRAIREGLEGLVLKGLETIYEPGKRHWLKMKKDYLDEGSMADTADLVCLGAYYGTGNKGGLMSVFLMGVYNAKRQIWQTVTKVGNGFDDKRITKLQKELDVVEINKSPNKVPDWLDVNRTLVPDFVVKDPKKAPVWEITGAEFSNSDSHTAAGISIRFPRVTRERDDKSWKEATDLERLKTLFKLSKEKSDFEITTTKKKPQGKKKDDEDEEEEEEEEKTPKKKENNKRPSAAAAKNNDSDDDDDKSANNKKKQKTTHNKSQPALPLLFTNAKIHLPAKCENLDKLKRYIIAYDGELVDDAMIDEATHVVTDDGKQTLNKSAKSIKLEDLWNCIKTKTSINKIK